MLDDEDWQSNWPQGTPATAHWSWTPRSSNSPRRRGRSGFLRDLYKEQGQAFGLDDEDFNGQTQLTPVLERLIKHVADRSAQQEVSATNKDILNRIGREIEAARFFADNNDIQYAVLLQRIWIKVLSLTLQRDATPPVRKMMTDLEKDLRRKRTGSLRICSPSCRAGEEKILRPWVLAAKSPTKMIRGWTVRAGGMRFFPGLLGLAIGVIGTAPPAPAIILDRDYGKKIVGYDVADDGKSD